MFVSRNKNGRRELSCGLEAKEPQVMMPMAPVSLTDLSTWGYSCNVSAIIKAVDFQAELLRFHLNFI
jgi:hypothetical protein